MIVPGLGWDIFRPHRVLAAGLILLIVDADAVVYGNPFDGGVSIGDPLPRQFWLGKKGVSTFVSKKGGA